MAAIRTRFLVAAASTAVACALAWVWVGTRRAPREAVRIVDNADGARDLLVERQRQMRGSVSGAAALLLDAPLVREVVPSQDAGLMFGIPNDSFEYDPRTYYRYLGGIDRQVGLPEHEDGAFHQRTSADGFREDFDRLPGKRDVLVVVTGDSHTDGLVDNDESFANRLEAKLAERHPGMAIEVLNAGVTGYSFYNYLGVLEKTLDLRPSAFVVAFYGGNDFLDVVKLWHYFHHTAPPPRRADYWDRLNRVTRVSNAAVANAFNQLLYFQVHPDQVDLALAGAAQACGEIQRVCKERGIALFFVYIPPGFDVDGVLKPMFAEAKEVLGLADSEFQQYHRLADKLIGVLRERGGEVVDLRERFPGDIDDFYWDDLHINVKGHELVADLLLPRIEAACFSPR